MKLALFDVDFTLTRKETLIAFYAFLVRKRPAYLRHLPKAAASGGLYQLGMIKEKETKEMFLAFLQDMPMERLDALCEEFLEKRLIPLLYADGLEKIAELKEKGYTIVLTSASPEFYITKLKTICQADLVMGTRFQVKEGRFTGIMEGENNKGAEKVLRLYTALEGQDVDYAESYMFSDSMSDEPLLKIVGKPFLINYRKRNPKYPVLFWR